MTEAISWAEIVGACRMMLDFLLGLLTDPAWVAVILATLALIPYVVKAGRWLHKRRQQRFIPQTQSKKDRANYGLLLQKYEGYLDLLSDLIVIRAQIEGGRTNLPPN